jgi:4,5-epoxidase
MQQRVGDAAPQIASGTWTSVFRFHRRIASTYRRQRMFLAGEAAHIHSALGGQGMNTGIGDVFDLGWKLGCVINGYASDRLLDTYEAERRPVATEIVRYTSRDWNILIGHTVFNRLFRDHVLLPLLRLPAIPAALARGGTQLRVSYRGGPLAEASLGERLWSLIHQAPLAGDRAPNVACRKLPSGAATMLGNLMSARWTLLLFGRLAKDRRAHVLWRRGTISTGSRSFEFCLPASVMCCVTFG